MLKRLRKNDRRLAKLADRLAIVLVYIDSQHGTLKPFSSEPFWTSDEANAIREMPFYNECVDKVREMVQ